jgi:hypothetical protein
MLLRIPGGKLPFGVQCKFVFLPCFMIHEILLSLSAQPHDKPEQVALACAFPFDLSVFPRI